MNEDFQNFLEDEMNPKTREFVDSYLRKTPIEEVPTFYYDAMISLKMAQMPSKEEKLKAIEETEGDIDAAKRNIFIKLVQNYLN